MRASELPTIARKFGHEIEMYHGGEGFAVVVGGSELSIIWHAGAVCSARFGDEEPENVEVWNVSSDSQPKGFVDAGCIAVLLEVLATNRS